MAATPGYKGWIKVGGTSTATTGEACSLVSGKTYKVTNRAKSVLDPAVARTWKDNGVAVSAANIASENLNGGTVTFTAGYTPTTPITVDANYIPLNAVAAVTKVTSFSAPNTLVETTAINGSGYKTRTATTQDAMAELELTDDLRTDLDPTAIGEQSWVTLEQNRTPVMVEFNPDGGSVDVFRFWGVLEDCKVSTDANGLFTGTVSAKLADRGTALALAGLYYGIP